VVVPRLRFSRFKNKFNGSLQWAKAYGGSGADTAFDVVVTSGGYLVLGKQAVMAQVEGTYS
jgi:hypothetical protein